MSNVPVSPYDFFQQPYTISAGQVSATFGNAAALNEVVAFKATTYGVNLDGRVAQDGACTNGSNLLSSVNISFSSSDIGKLILLTGSTSQTNQFGRIMNLATASSVILDRNVNGTLQNGYLIVGSDVTQTLQGALNSVQGNATLNQSIFPAILELPSGIGFVTSTITIPDGVRVIGKGSSYPGLATGGNPTGTPAMQGTALVATAPSQGFGGSIVVKVGVTASPPGQGVPTIGANQSSLQDVTVDASRFIATTVALAGSKATAFRVTAQRGFSCQFGLGAGDTRCIECISDGTGNVTNNGIIVTGNDTQIRDNYIYGYGGASTAGIKINNAGDCLISRNHIFQFTPIGSALGGNCVMLNQSASGNVSGIQITENVFDGTFGHQIAISALGGGSVNRVNIGPNYFQQVNGLTQAAFDAVNILCGSSATVSQISVQYNMGAQIAANADFRSIVNLISTSGGTTAAISCIGNQFSQMNTNVLGGPLPGNVIGNSWVSFSSAAAAVSYDDVGRVSQVTSFATSITPDFTKGTTLNVSTLTNSTTINNPSANPATGQTVSIYFVQDGSGGKTVSWGTSFQFGSTLPFVNAGNAAGTRTAASFTFDGTQYYALGQNVWH